MEKTDLTQFSEAELKKAIQEKKKKTELDKTTFKELSQEFVNKNIDFWIGHNQITQDAINQLWADFKPLQELKASVYGTEINGQDSHTSTLEDGSASITIGYNVTIGFDGTESEGVKKIKEFIYSLSTEDENNKKLSAAVNTFLKPNAKTGLLNPSKIIELSKLEREFKDEQFSEGLKIIFEAQQRRQNSMYVSGWKFVQVDGIPKKLEFRFTV